MPKQGAVNSVLVSHVGSWYLITWTISIAQQEARARNQSVGANKGTRTWDTVKPPAQRHSVICPLPAWLAELSFLYLDSLLCQGNSVIMCLPSRPLLISSLHPCCSPCGSLLIQIQSYLSMNALIACAFEFFSKNIFAYSRSSSTIHLRKKKGVTEVLPLCFCCLQFHGFKSSISQIKKEKRLSVIFLCAQRQESNFTLDMRLSKFPQHRIWKSCPLSEICSWHLCQKYVPWKYQVSQDLACPSGHQACALSQAQENESSARFLPPQREEVEAEISQGTQAGLTKRVKETHAE